MLISITLRFESQGQFSKLQNITSGKGFPPSSQKQYFLVLFPFSLILSPFPEMTLAQSLRDRLHPVGQTKFAPPKHS